MKKELNCVLLIDDDEATNYMNNMLLEEANCNQRIEIAEGGQQALAYLASCNSSSDAVFPDLIFLDINMPAMNGWEFLENFRQLVTPAGKKPVIVMLSTSSNPDDKLKSQRIGLVDAFESKPLNQRIIANIMSKYFETQVQTA